MRQFQQNDTEDNEQYRKNPQGIGRVAIKKNTQNKRSGGTDTGPHRIGRAYGDVALGQI